MVWYCCFRLLGKTGSFLLQVLCLQLRRVFWTRKGRLAKIRGHISFPEVLDLTPYTAAAAEPLLPAARPLVSHPLSGLLAKWRAPDQANGGSHRVTTHASTSARSQFSADVEQAPLGVSSAQRHVDAGTLSRTAGAVDSRQDSLSFAENDDNFPKAEAASIVERERKLRKYQLTSVVVHHGGAQSGHYTVYRRVPSFCLPAIGESCQSVLNNCRTMENAPEYVGVEECYYRAGACGSEGEATWVHASDEHVRTVSLEEVLSCEATVLLYERRSERSDTRCM
jgi:hypothetical protein